MLNENNWLIDKYIAHRGLFNKTLPENSLGAFQNAIDKGYAIELDVHQISDGTLVVFHDDLLSRATNKDGYVKNLKKEDLKDCHLFGTEYTIPTLNEVLALVDGKTELLIEVKNESKVGSLEKELLLTLKSYNGKFAIESFNPFVLEWFLKHEPKFIRGQLSCYFKNNKMNMIKKYILKSMKFNNKTKPNFIAYDGTCLPNRFVNKYKQLPVIAYNINSQKEYEKVAPHCENIIFQDFIPKI